MIQLPLWTDYRLEAQDFYNEWKSHGHYDPKYTVDYFERLLKYYKHLKFTMSERGYFHMIPREERYHETNESSIS